MSQPPWLASTLPQLRRCHGGRGSLQSAAMKTVQKALAHFSLLLALASGALFLAGCETPPRGGAGGTTNLEALRAAANGGDADAAMKLGDAYFNGRGVLKNNIEAENWYKKAAELYQKK